MWQLVRPQVQPRCAIAEQKRILGGRGRCAARGAASSGQAVRGDGHRELDGGWGVCHCGRSRLTQGTAGDWIIWPERAGAMVAQIASPHGRVRLLTCGTAKTAAVGLPGGVALVSLSSGWAGRAQRLDAAGAAIAESQDQKGRLQDRRCRVFQGWARLRGGRVELRGLWRQRAWRLCVDCRRWPVRRRRGRSATNGRPAMGQRSWAGAEICHVRSGL